MPRSGSGSSSKSPKLNTFEGWSPKVERAHWKGYGTDTAKFYAEFVKEGEQTCELADKRCANDPEYRDAVRKFFDDICNFAKKAGLDNEPTQVNIGSSGLRSVKLHDLVKEGVYTQNETISSQIEAYLAMITKSFAIMVGSFQILSIHIACEDPKQQQQGKKFILEDCAHHTGFARFKISCKSLWTTLGDETKMDSKL